LGGGLIRPNARSLAICSTFFSTPGSARIPVGWDSPRRTCQIRAGIASSTEPMLRRSSGKDKDGCGRVWRQVILDRGAGGLHILVIGEVRGGAHYPRLHATATRRAHFPGTIFEVAHWV
jgi:hypothetical protein